MGQSTWDRGMLSINTLSNPGAENLNPAMEAGGLGNYGWVRDANGNIIDINQDAYNSIVAGDTTGLEFGKFSGTAGQQTDWLSSLGSMQGLGGVALGGGRLALGLASYLDQSKTAKKQRKLIDQQIANNEFVLNKRKQNSESLAKAFGTWTGGSNGTTA
ncbi:hypothetical protein [Hydrogenimonas sp.]